MIHRTLAVAAMIAAAVPCAAQTTPAVPTPASGIPSTPSATLPAPSPSPAPNDFWRARPFASSALPTFASSTAYVQSYEQGQSYGRCVSHIGPKIAGELLSAAPNTVDERQAFRHISVLSRGCLSYGYRAPIVFLRGGIAEAMYRREPQQATLHIAGTTQSELTAFDTAEAVRSVARLEDDRAFTMLGNCLATRAPQPTRSVLLSQHGSADERKAFVALFAFTPSCVQGAQFPKDGATSFIRAYLAEAAYRWSTFLRRTQALSNGGVVQTVAR